MSPGLTTSAVASAYLRFTATYGRHVCRWYSGATISYAESGPPRRFKLFGVVTNRDLPGDELIRWHRERCGKSEEVHAVMKDDLAGGRLPSKLFGANAAWWGTMILALNLNMLMKRLVLGAGWVTKRMKAIRYWIINLPGRLVKHARQLSLRLSADHPSASLLIEARRTLVPCMVVGHAQRTSVRRRPQPLQKLLQVAFRHLKRECVSG